MKLPVITDPKLKDGAGTTGIAHVGATVDARNIQGRVDLASLHGRPTPERRSIVDGLVPEGNVTIFSGDGGLGKSLIALQLAGACALAKTWVGRATRHCKVLAIACEDDDEELHRRLEAIARYYGADVGDLAEHIDLYTRVGHDNLLMTWPDQYGQGQTTPFFDQISNRAAEHGAELVVLDSLHDLFGGNENNRAHARQFIGRLRWLAMQIRGAVLLIAHPSLTGRNTGTGEAGSTAWHNAVRSRLYLTGPKTEDGQTDAASDYRELVVKKFNYGVLGGRILLRWKDGVFVADERPAGVLGAIKRRTAEQVFLACLDAVLAQGRTVSESSQARNYAPKVLGTMPEAGGVKMPDLAEAMVRLFAAKAIRVGPVGKSASRHARQSVVRTATVNSDDEGEE